MKNTKILQCGGFTLLEVIVTMTVAVILATILASFMGSNISGSVTPLVRVQNANTLSRVFENITSDYNKLNFDDNDAGTSVALSTLSSHIDSGNVSTSDPYYGSYTVVYKGYIAFDSGGNQTADTSGNNTVLKVTLKQGDQTITTLFTK
jgi:prepilin-type N-terminal cleavage/methylation domain-containing protein